MRLVESIRCKLLPVTPYLFQYLRIMTVTHTALDKLGLHGIYDVLLLLTHRLTEGIALASGEVGQQATQQHDLLLIHGNTISILQVLLHNGDVVLDFLLTILSGNKGRDIIHRTRTVQSIHGNKVLEHRGTEFLEILLHTCRLELERTDSTTFLIELVCQLIVYGERIRIYFYTMCFLNHTAGLLHLGQGLQAKEVHLDQAGRFNHMTIILRNGGLLSGKIRVVSRTDRNVLRYRIATDNKATGMNTRTSDISLQHTGIFDGVRKHRIGACLCLL